MQFFSAAQSAVLAPRKEVPVSSPQHPEPACRHLPHLLEKGPPSRFGCHCHLHIAAINRPGCCRRSGPRRLGCRGEKVCFPRYCLPGRCIPFIVVPIYLSGTNFTVDASMSAWSDFSFSCHTLFLLKKTILLAVRYPLWLLLPTLHHSCPNPNLSLLQWP